MIEFMDEERASKVLRSFLKPGEMLESVEKAINYRWGRNYYVGITETRAILLNWSFYNDRYMLTEVPREGMDEFMRRKRIRPISFDTPFLTREKDFALYERLKGAVSGDLEAGERLISFAKARRAFKNFLIAITDRRIMMYGMGRKTSLQGPENISFSSLRDAALLYGKKPVAMEIPYEGNYNLKIKLSLLDGTVETYNIIGLSSYSTTVGI